MHFTGLVCTKISSENTKALKTKITKFSHLKANHQHSSQIKIKTEGNARVK